jgi:hypothetical protein
MTEINAVALRSDLRFPHAGCEGSEPAIQLLERQA